MVAIIKLAKYTLDDVTSSALLIKNIIVPARNTADETVAVDQYAYLQTNGGGLSLIIKPRLFLEVKFVP